MKKGILLVNLGTPDSFKPSDVYKYLIEFLTDPRVIDLPYFKRQLLVRGIIVPFRYKQSAKCYKQIWTDQGSPLLTYGKQLQQLLQESMGENYVVKLAMRYQSPSLEKALNAFQKENIHDLTILPLFPQYSSACTGSIYEKAFSILSKWQVMPSLRFVSDFYSQKNFIEAHVERGKSHNLEDYDHILFSFHGLPEKLITKADTSNLCLKCTTCCDRISSKNEKCYRAQCFKTAHLIAGGLKLPQNKYSITFQSRLGKDPWLSPYTAKVLEEFPKKGIKKVLVFCPSFICDCLETLYEMEVENDELFKEHGGEKLTLVESLNTHPLWIKALKEIALDSQEIPTSKPNDTPKAMSYSF